MLGCSSWRSILGSLSGKDYENQTVRIVVLSDGSQVRKNFNLRSDSTSWLMVALLSVPAIFWDLLVSSGRIL